MSCFIPAAQAQGVAAQFPGAAQVQADYPNDEQRFVALNTLWDWMRAKAPDDADARAKRKSYYDAAQAIRQRYIADFAQGQQFDARAHELDTPAFERSVLQRYQVLDVAAEAPAFRPGSGDVTDAMIQRGVLMALPFVVAGLVAMWLLCVVMLRFSSNGEVRVTPPCAPGQLPALPESLRVVKLPGLSYSVEVLSGIAVDKESVVHHTTTTTTVPGQVQVTGNQVYVGPNQTYTHTTSTKVDTLWVRRPDGLEESWTFTGDVVQARPGHLLSALGWRGADGRCHFLLAYNHSTGQHATISPGPHATRGCLAWVLSFLVGTVAFAIAIAVLLSIDRDFVSTMDATIRPVVYLVMGAMGSLVAATLVMFFVSGGVMRKRNARFNRDYVPAFRQFLESLTPAVRRCFG